MLAVAQSKTGLGITDLGIDLGVLNVGGKLSPDSYAGIGEP